MSGFSNDVVYGKNADFTQADNQAVSESNGLILNGQLWIGRTSANAGGTHIDVGTLTAGAGISIVNGPGSITISSTIDGGIETINGDSGSITGSTVTVFANNATNNSGNSVSFVNSGTISTMNLTDSSNNTTLGKGAGKAGQTYNSVVALGYNAGHALETGSGSVFIGFEAGLKATSGRNVFIGENSGQESLTSSANTAIGTSSLQNLTTGTVNVAIGNSAGSNYTTNESDNIVIANNGTGGESGVIRLGNQSNQTTCFIAGINGVTNSNPVLTTINSSTGQLGVQALTQYALVSGGASNAVNLIPTTATARQILQSQGSSAQPAYSTATYPATTTINRLLYSTATNTIGELASTARASLTTDSSGVPTWRALTDGQFVIGSSSSQPIAANITAGTGISVVNGANSITISTTQSSKITSYTSNDTWTIDPRSKSVRMIGWGGGGGGGSGRCGASASAGGGAGGGAGVFVDVTYDAASLSGSPYTVTIGTGGAGGTLVNATNTNGNAGTQGTTTSVGTVLVAIGGGGGAGGTTTSATGGSSIWNSGGISIAGVASGGSGTNGTASSVNFIYGYATGGGGGSGYASATPKAGATGPSITDTAATVLVAGGLAGDNTGANAGNGNAPSNQPFYIGATGGGGGGHDGVTTAGSGGNGAVPGGGGGGGAGNLSLNNSGAGGTGGNGKVIIIEYF